MLEVQKVSTASASAPDYITNGIAAVKANDQNGITDFIETITPHLRHTAVRLLQRDDQATDDLVQEALLRIVTKIDSYDRNRPFYAWANKILTNVFLVDTGKRKPMYSNSRYEDATGVKDGEAIPRDPADMQTLAPLDEIMLAETEDGLSRAVAAARRESPKGYRTWEAITSGNKTIEGVADESGQTKAAVKKQATRFRARVRRHAEENGTIAESASRR